jgi:thymidine phosphorylase
LDALVLDVKTGAGAFMISNDDSRKLAEALVKTGREFGVKTEAVISDMSQPLGRFVGNSLEVYECVKVMRGEADELMSPTLDLSLELSARMLLLAGKADDIDSARSCVSEALQAGRALEKFALNIELQGGHPSVCDDPEPLLDRKLIKTEITAPISGYISEFDALAVGHAIVAIGGGRTKAEDPVDHAVGYECLAKIGDRVEKGQPLAILYCRDESQADRVRPSLLNAYTVSETECPSPELVRDRVS